jgi:hypothetical protein
MELELLLQLRLRSSGGGCLGKEVGQRCHGHLQKGKRLARCGWLMPVILATQAAVIRRIVVQSQPQGNSLQDLILKKPFSKKGWWYGSGGRAPA